MAVVIFKEAPLACDALIGLTTKGNFSLLFRTLGQAPACRSVIVRGAGKPSSFRSLRKKYLLADRLQATELLHGKAVPLKSWEILPLDILTAFSGKKAQ